MTGVRYPFGKLSDGSAVHIADYRNELVSCFGCPSRLIAKRGTIAWHFAHHPSDETTSCESALHKMAKAVIAQAHRAATASERRYPLTWFCDACETERSLDIARHGHEALVEASAIDGVRSDIYFLGEKPFAVEVVVENDLSEETASKYAQANVPVFLVYPTWDNIEQLRHAVPASECLGLKSCGGCDAKPKRELEFQARFEVLKAAFKAETNLTRLQATRIVGTWPPAIDPFDDHLSSKVQCRLQDLAIRLVSAGFQFHRRSWTFTRVLLGREGSVEINFGRSMVPSWSRYPAVMRLHLNVPLETHEVFGELVEWHLRKHVGVLVNPDWRDDVLRRLKIHRDSFRSAGRLHRRTARPRGVSNLCSAKTAP